MSNRYAEILLPRKINGGKDTLTYKIPQELENKIPLGSLVEVPLRNTQIRGVVIETHNIKPSFNTKEITKVIEDFYTLSKTQLKVLKFISKRHFAPLFQTIKLFYSTNIFSRKRSKEIAPPKKNHIHHHLNSLYHQIKKPH